MIIEEFVRLIQLAARRDLRPDEQESLKAMLLQMIGQRSSVLDALSDADVKIGLNADLLDGHHGSYYRDADTLDGHHGDFYRDASNLNAGTLHTDRFSAYADLVSENKIGMSEGQVAPGNHTHEGSSGGGGDIYFYVDGALDVVEGAVYQVVPRNAVIAGIYGFCQNTGTSGTTIVDIHKNGTTIFTDPNTRLTIPYNDTDGVASTTPAITGLTAGDVLRLDIDQVASGASNLAVVIAMNYLSVQPPIQQLYFARPGLVEVGPMPYPIYNHTGRTRWIQKVWLTVTGPPTGSDLVVDVKKDNVSIFASGGMPRINAGQTSGYSTNIADGQWDESEALWPEIVQVGSTYGGDNLVITIVYT